MNIGITAVFKGSAFSASLPQVAVFIARALTTLGHTVHFLIPSESDDWFVDCPCGTDIQRVKLQAGTNVILYDLVIEICWFLPPEVRKQIGQRIVMFYHEPPTFNDMEKSVYKAPVLLRNFKGVDAIWTWSHFHETDFDYLEILSRCPVYKCPYIWEPFFLENCTKSPTTESKQTIPHIIICENNKSNTSSCVIPLTILSEIKKKEPEISWSVMNSNELVKRQYFVKNIIENLYLGSDISGHFISRVRIVDFQVNKCCIISHQRWLPIKYMLLDALWLGIPLIHNCEAIKFITGGENFYELNRIDRALVRWNQIKQADAISDKVLEKTRSEINSEYGPNKFKRAIPFIIDKLRNIREPVIRLAFCDMWAEFNPDHNLFTGILKFTKTNFIKDLVNPNLVIFGPFGKAHEKFKSIPKIYYTGENLPPSTDSDVKLNIGFQKQTNSEIYLRIPNWILELNLFGIDEVLAKNPSPFNPNLLFRKHSGERTKFCIFVASRPMCNERNTLYNIVSKYKKVDSCGSVFTNSEWIPSGPGGSNGQKAKVKAYESYKFVIVGENSKSHGYITEKLLHAKLAGCVPIYWGDDSVYLDFEKDSFLNVSDFANEDELLNRISYLDSNNIAWKAIAEKPLIKESKISHWKEVCAGLAKTCMNLIKPLVCEFVYPMEPIQTNKPRIIVSAFNGKFVKSAIRLIKSCSEEIYVWVWDTTKEQRQQLSEAGAKGVYEFNCDWVPKDFSDFWNPNHYAWKPLLWNELQKERILNLGTSVLYLDAGVEIVGNLTNVWSIIESEDIFVCNIEHKMIAWCKPEFYNCLSMTVAEGEALQYTSAVVGFKIGGKFKDVFVKVAEYGKDPSLICGKKWHRYSKDCYGHRQDQSILSLVGIRAKVKPYEWNKYSGEISQNQSKEDGKVFYLHRGLWKKTLTDEIDGINAFRVVNLAHRSDRLDKFYKAHLFLKEKCLRVEAVYGKQMNLSSETVRLFRNNDFNWKKGVIGCALSHYELWKQIAKGELGSRVLIFEDDAILVDGFVSTWNSIVDDIPGDSDVIMLGGVLPPNKKVLPLVTEQVNTHFGRIKPHNLGNVLSNTFHFCTYSYVLTVSGAKKLCTLIDEKGIFTSIDHMLVSNMNSLLNFYFTTPLLAGCFQDSDEAYVNADFNNFNRIDKYDSEIWNNIDVFNSSDLSGVLPVIYFESGQDTGCLEQGWLEEITGRKFVWIHCSQSVRFPKNTCVCVYYQHTTNPCFIDEWITQHGDYYLFLLHLSDEACNSDVQIYKHGNIKKVFRNYWRHDVVCEKVVHLPLGYNTKKSLLNKPLLERKYAWSFAGAMDRPMRKEILESIQKTGLEGNLHTTPTWGSSENLSSSEYANILSETKIVPCMPGFHNSETFRFYETLESGAIPMVLLDEKNSYSNILSGSINPPLLAIAGTDWSVIAILGTQDSILKKTCDEIQQWWVGYKLYLKKLVRSILSGEAT